MLIVSEPELGSIWVQIEASRRSLLRDAALPGSRGINLARDIQRGMAQERLHRSDWRTRGFEHPELSLPSWT